MNINKKMECKEFLRNILFIPHFESIVEMNESIISCLMYKYIKHKLYSFKIE